MATFEPQPCATEGCNMLVRGVATACPACKKDPELSKHPSYFHSQECFKKSWKEHKARYHPTYKTSEPTVEADYKGPAGTYDPLSPANLPSFAERQKIPLRRDATKHQYTGTLRACYPLKPAPKREIPSHIVLPDYAKDGEFSLEGVRNILSVAAYGLRTAAAGLKIGRRLKPPEIVKARKVCQLAREVLDLAAAALKPGITTLEIDEIVHNACMERNSYPSPLGYYRFPRSVCTSINEVVCHGIPDARPLEEGDIINLDVTLYHDGYHGDLNATYPVGKVTPEADHLIKSTRRCLDRAIAECKPGVLYRDLGGIIEPMALEAGLTVNKRYVGHGINTLFHCAPNIPHYAQNKAVDHMRVGQVFTIEPMINEGGFADEHWPDNWTCVTADGKRSAQFEETLLVTEDGIEVLTAQKGWQLPEDFKGVAKGVVKNLNV